MSGMADLVGYSLTSGDRTQTVASTLSPHLWQSCGPRATDLCKHPPLSQTQINTTPLLTSHSSLPWVHLEVGLVHQGTRDMPCVLQLKLYLHIFARAVPERDGS